MLAIRRRGFLALLGGGLALPRWLSAEHHVVSADPLVVEFDLKSLRGLHTSVEDFYVRNHFDAPLAAGQAALQVEGEVERPCRLAPADVAPFPERDLGVVLECAGDGVGPMGLVSNGSWAGWPLAAVLSSARPTRAAAHLHLFGRDGYARSVPMERALEGGVLVTHLNQRPLTRQHGAPWRALFPGWYGMDSVKWLERMVVSAVPLPSRDGSYQELVQGAEGELSRQPLPRVQVKSVIVDPAEGAVLRPGLTPIHGLAWSGEGTISSVEVSWDGGRNWLPARVGEGKDFNWTLWHAAVELTQPGAVELVSRARDIKGFAQPARRDPGRLDGYANNWYHRVRCVVA